MNYWYKLMRFFFYNAVKNHPSKTIAHQLVNMGSAKSIGIVYDGSSTENAMAVDKFIADIEGQKLRVQTLAYLPKEKNAIPKSNTFSSADVGFYYVPKGDTVAKFCDQQFDILFALFPHENLPLEYIAQTSKAICRVGLYNADKTDCFELMIKPVSTNSLAEHIHQANTLLNQIKHD